MSLLAGGIRQNGYVVDDLDEAIRYWTNVIGVGPFFRADHVPLDFFTHEGRPSAPDLNIALANSGDVQLELIQQLNDAPSPWRNFALAKGSGLHHVSGWTETYEADLTRLAARGLVPTVRGPSAVQPASPTSSPTTSTAPPSRSVISNRRTSRDSSNTSVNRRIRGMATIRCATCSVPWRRSETSAGHGGPSKYVNLLERTWHEA